MLKSAAKTALCFFSPISPSEWWPQARRLSSAHGWMPSMLLLAVVGIVFPLSGFGRRLNLPWLGQFNLAVWITWGLIAIMAVLLTTCRSARVLRRFGYCGLLRHRWWFELAFISWNLTTVALTAVLLSLLPANQQRQWLDGLFDGFFAAAGIAFPAFVVFGSVGYLLSFVRRRPRTGRAFECVHYFYCILGPISLLTAAALLLPPRPAVGDIAGPALLGAAGVVWLGVGLLSILHRYERWEREQSCLSQPVSPDPVHRSEATG